MHKIKQIGWLLLLVSNLGFAAQVNQFVLDNGLKLIVKQDKSHPDIALQVWYKVGSSDEPTGLTGISHMLEYMMFKGTKNVAPDEFVKSIRSQGGQVNAFTGQDYTVYTQKIPQKNLNLGLKLEADRMQNLLISKDEFEKSRRLIIRRRHQLFETNPIELLQEQFYAAAYVNSSAHHPVIGWKTDIEHYTREDVMNWYKRWYAPNNATLVVVGNVDPQQVYKLTKQYFDAIKSRKTPSVKPQKEIAQRAFRKVEMAAPTPIAYTIMGWKVPVLKTISSQNRWQVYALKVMEAVLSGPHGRFDRDLIRQNIARRLVAKSTLYSMDNDLFIIAGQPAKGRTDKELENAISQQITSLKTTLISQQELTRVKQKMLRHSLALRHDVEYEAAHLGLLETIGLGVDTINDYPNQIEAITPEQIQWVANQYFRNSGLTMAKLVPERPRPHP